MSLSRIAERHKGLIRFPQREGSLQGEIKEYVLSPEELAKYRALPLPEEAKKKLKKKVVVPAPPKEVKVKEVPVKRKEKNVQPKKKVQTEKKRKREKACVKCNDLLSGKNKTGLCLKCKKVPEKFCSRCEKKLSKNNMGEHCMSCKGKILCKVDGCENFSESRGMCCKHRSRMRRHGNPIGRLCSLDGCENKHKNGGYCNFHYARFRKYGSPHYLKQREGNTWFIVDERSGKKVETEQTNI